MRTRRVSKLEEERRNASISYVVIHLLILIPLFSTDNPLTACWFDGTAYEGIIFLILVIVEFILYFRMQRSYPGFVDVERKRIVAAKPSVVEVVVRNDPQALEEETLLDALSSSSDSSIPLSEAASAASTSTAGGSQRVIIPSTDTDQTDSFSVPRDESEDREMRQGREGLEAYYGGKFCRACKFTRPARSKHCYVCGHCIVVFDHHCPFYANCVGRRNHRDFWWSLTTITAALAWAFAMNYRGFGMSKTSFSWVVHLAVAVLISMCLFMGVCLWATHTFFAVTNQTTWQMIVTPSPYSQEVSALRRSCRDFNRGLRQNVSDFCLGEFDPDCIESPELERDEEFLPSSPSDQQQPAAANQEAETVDHLV